MLYGRWIFLSFGALLGVLLIFEFHWLTLILLLFVVTRIILEKRLQIFLIFLLLFACFAYLSSTSENSRSTSFSSGPITTEITFHDTPHIDGNRLRSIILTPTNEKWMFTYSIQSEKEQQHIKQYLQVGTTCVTTGELMKPDVVRNENAFDYRTYLYRNDIYWIYRAEQLQLGTCHMDRQNILQKLRQVRVQFIVHIEEKFSPGLIPYVKALIFGDRGSFPEESYQMYQQIGVVHLLAISGLHIGLLISIMYFLLLRCGISKETVYWILVIFLPIYAILSGGNPPVIRAVITAILLLSAKKWRLPITTMDAFAISFILFLGFDPYIIYHIGFQLSYLVSFSIIMSSQLLLKNQKSYFKGMVDISIISTITSLPVLTYHFYEFSLIGVIANLFFVPLYSVIILPLLLLLFFLSFGSTNVFIFLCQMAEKLIYISERIAYFVQSFKYANVITGKPSIWMTLLMMGTGILYFYLAERKVARSLAILPVVFSILAQLLMTTYPIKGEVVFIDVGQGDSILIRLPFNRGTYLIDTGGEVQFPKESWEERRKPFTVADYILLPFLKSKGIRQIDKLILTHGDIDHIGAAKDLLSHIQIKKIYIPPNSWEKGVMKELVDETLESNIAIFEKKAGTSWENRSGQFMILYPFAGEYEGNNSSLVLFGRFGGLDWIFMGDVENEGENTIVNTYPNLQADVIKIGHHGSRTSTTKELIELLKPTYAIISAGANNRHGHPHAEVLQLLEKYNIDVYRTDQHGAIHYTFSSNGGTFKTILQYDKNISDTIMD